MAVEHIDGRAARAARTRDAIVDALFELLHEGSVQPTSDEIAARAGVAPRTVFVHFPDREELYSELASRQAERIAPLFTPIAAEGPLEERLTAFCAQRARVLEAIGPMRRAALLLEPFSPTVAGGIREFRALKRAQVERVFAPEIASRPAAERPLLCAALGAAAAWTQWQALREHQGLSAVRARRAMEGTLRALLTMH